MVKNFQVRIPRRKRRNYQQELNYQTPEYARVDLINDPDLPDIDIDKPLEIRRFPGFINAYIKTPTSAMYKALPPGTIAHEDYVQHRQMDEGRAIVLTALESSLTRRHPRRWLKTPVDEAIAEGVWVFTALTRGEEIGKPGFLWAEKDYTVTWDGVDGVPRAGLSSSSFGAFAADAFVWAVYWFTHQASIPADSLWLPIPSVYPGWNALGIGPPFPEYNLSL